MAAIFVAFLFILLSPSSGKSQKLARTPPRGWNSYDSFSWTISEEEFLQNAQLVAQRLLPLGYEFVVVDYLWYRKKVDGASADSLGFDVIDEWGRMIPDPGRWPSSSNGKGFTEVASEVHNLGLKFGIHIMRGISTQAYNANTPILDIASGKQYEENGKKWFAKDIGIPERPCAWMKNGFMSVNVGLGAGKAFLSSLQHQYADWGVDFVKHDCTFGDDFDPDEIAFVSSFLKKSSRPVVYSLSPGTNVTPAMASNVSDLVNMYRITGDDWDKWEDVASHFDISRDLAAASKIGGKGQKGKSWPDLDMLPFGWLTDPGSNEGPHRSSNLTLDEQKTQITLWAIAKSPLMFGGDMRRLDDVTFGLISNPTILKINSFSKDNKEFPYISSTKINQRFDHGKSDRDGNSKVPALVLTSCSDVEARHWSVKANEKDPQQVCWKQEEPSNEKQGPFCLHTRKPLLKQDVEVKHDGKLLLLDTKMPDVCLGASPSHRLTSSRTNRVSFSPCGLETNQMWELNQNGTLKSSYTGLCATMKNINVATGVRAWIATKTKDPSSLYLAFFNLNADRAQVSAKIQDLGKAVPGKKFSSCRVEEVWSGKRFGRVNDAVSIQIEGHGTALFVLLCDGAMR